MSRPLLKRGGGSRDIPSDCTTTRTIRGRTGTRTAVVRCILGLLSLAKRYGNAAVDDASAAALELHVYEYRFVRRYLERRLPLTLRQVDALIRKLTQYRDLINLRIEEQEHS